MVLELPTMVCVSSCLGVLPFELYNSVSLTFAAGVLPHQLIPLH